MVNLSKLLDDLSTEDVINIVLSLGADRYQEQDDSVIFPTICHHENAEDGSMKLYYYKENKRFHCYTECSSTFNLYTLIEKVFILRGGNKVESKDKKKKPNDFCFFDTVKYVMNGSNVIVDFNENQRDRYVSDRQRYQRKKRQIKLETYPEQILDIFEKEYPIEWLQEGITKEAMDMYNIRYSISRNKIIIPHYDWNRQLIGIRGRALDEEEAATFGKYMPVEIEGKWYAHPLSQNLYGLYLAQEAIQKSHRVIIFEGEKSCLLYQGYLGEANNSVACCGSSINKAQINLLMETCAPSEIVVAFDKEFENPNDEKAEKYFNKLYDMCKKYFNYANFSFIFDREGLLGLKDSPIDRGFDIYKKLFESRVIVK